MCGDGFVQCKNQQQILIYLHFGELCEVSPRFVISNKINLHKVNQIKNKQTKKPTGPCCLLGNEVVGFLFLKL